MKTKYLSQVRKNIPKNCLFDKGKVGCGGTSLALECEDPFVVCVPFISLVENKVSQYPNKRRSEPILGVTGDTKISDIKSYLKAVRTPKIVVTYDSLPKVSSCVSTKDFRLLIDEYHLLFLQYSFRKEAVQRVLSQYRLYKDFCFMTATPLEEDFILEELKNIPVVRQDWEDVLNIQVQAVKCRYVKSSTVKLVKAFLDGTCAGNAYLFVNSVKFIKQIIDIVGLTDKNTRVIYSPNNKTELPISNSRVDSKPKKINFLTSTVFEGSDIYDPNGRIIIISDPSKCQTLLDISTSIQQIAGRIRNSKYINQITHLYGTTRYSELSYEDFLEISRQTEADTKRLVEKINNSDSEVREFIYNKTDVSDKYMIANKEDYTFEFDPNLVKIDLFNYKVCSKTYSVRVELSEEYLKAGMESKNRQDNSIKIEFNTPNKGSFKETVKAVREELKDEYRLESPVYESAIQRFPFLKAAIEQLGFEKIESLDYIQKDIKNELLKLSDRTQANKIAYKLDKRISVGKFYSKADIKKALTDTYNDLEINNIAKSTELGKYYQVKATQKRIDGKPVEGYTILAKKYIFS